MTPPVGLVCALHAYDPKLRLRWWPTSEEWVIEQPLPPRDPEILRTLRRDHVTAVATMRARLGLAIPGSPSYQATARQIDAVGGALDGYKPIVFVPPSLIERTETVMQALRDGDLEHRTGTEDFNRSLDELAASATRARDHERRAYVEHVARDTYDRIAWLDGRRVTTSDMAEGALTRHVSEEHEGFTVRVRKCSA